MKIQKSNNPLAVTALLLVLAVIVSRIIWMLTRGDGSSAPVVRAASVVTRTPTPVTPSAPPAPAVPRAEAVLTPKSKRDPFSRRTPRGVSAPRVPSSVADHKTPIPTAPPAAGFVKPLPIMPIPPARPRPVAWTGPSHSTGVRVMPILGTPRLKSVPAPEPDPLQGLTLTAIVGGTQPMAVLQTSQPEPVVVHLGDHIEGLRVEAINEQDVVFSRGSRLWTLPLQSAPTAGSTVTITAEDPPLTQETVDESR